MYWFCAFSWNGLSRSANKELNGWGDDQTSMASEIFGGETRTDCHLCGFGLGPFGVAGKAHRMRVQSQHIEVEEIRKTSLIFESITKYYFRKCECLSIRTIRFWFFVCHFLRQSIGQRDTKLVLVLLQRHKTTMDDSVANEKALELCQHCRLNSRYLFVLPRLPDERTTMECIGRLEKTFHDIAQVTDAHKME